MTDVNVVVKNMIWERNKDLVKYLFSDEEIRIVNADLDMYDILVLGKFFSSKSEAKKNWKKTGREIPLGFSDFFIGKLKNRLTIFNPRQ